VLKPGGHLLAFGGTRTVHRIAVAIEDAGFEIRDQIVWMYGSGFPKSHNIGAGFGTALKPAHEPIIVARKPLIGTVAANVTAHGTGALNIDGCRIGSDGGCRTDAPYAGGKRGAVYNVGLNEQRSPCVDGLGRWPANVCLDETAAEMLDAQSGASRFFYVAKASRAERNAGLDGMAEKPLNWSAGTKNPGSFQSDGTHKAAQNHHPTVKPVALMRWLVRLVTPPGGVVCDPFLGSGTTGIAAVLEDMGFVGIEQSAEYLEIARRRIAHAQGPLLTTVRTK
jgi:hypothetical protein